MAIDLYNDHYFGNDEMAVLISEIVEQLPLLKYEAAKKKKNSISLFVTDNKGDKQNIRYNGIYFIYEKKRTRVTCLYIGKSDKKNTIYTRLYRWAVGIFGIEKDYEQRHCAAEKARKDGIKNSKYLYVKYMTWDDIENIMPKIEKRYDRDVLDEKIASIIKPKYNVRGV